MELDYASDDQGGREILSVANAVDAIAAPFRALLSKQAQRAYLSTLLFIITSLTLLCISAVAYWIFYLKFIPQVGLQRDVHLQFGDGHPWGTASLGSELVSLQPYDVSVKLELPRTPSNLAAGNFMLDLTLLSRPSTSLIPGTNTSAAPVATSHRPAILTYASPIVDTANKLSRMPLYVVGWHREAETLEVQMMERVEFARGWRNLPESLRLEIRSDEKMQIYHARVEFHARFTGLRWLMYKWKFTSFLVFSSMFWGMSMLSTSIAWLVLASFLGSGTTKPERKIMKEESDGTPIKEESDDESVDTSSDPQAAYSRASGEKRIKEEDEAESNAMPSASDTDDANQEDGEQQYGTGSYRESASGTGLESAEARGVQRRRSHHARDEH